MPDAAEWLRPCAHPVYGRLLVAELRRRGIEPEAFLHGTGLDWATLRSGSELLSYAQLHRLVRRAAALVPVSTLGLDVGLSTELSAHGAVGYAGLTGTSVAQALRVLQRFSPSRQRLVTFDLDLAGAEPALTLRESLADAEVRHYVLGHVTGALLRLLQAITGRDWTHELVLHWPSPPPADATAWLARVAGLRFGAAVWRLELTPALLDSPCLAPDAEAHRLALRECELQLARQARGTVASRVRARLVGCDGAYPGLQAMAALEHVSARTLIRRLRAEGETYQTLLDRARADQACWLLVRSDLPVQAIAARLGYADPSNFSRSFRRWCSVTPRAFREGGG